MNSTKVPIIIIVFISLFTTTLYGQKYDVEHFGFRQFEIQYQSESINILVKSKKGEEKIKKPLFLFLQGSLPQPLIMLAEKPEYSPTVVPFLGELDTLLQSYHFVIISKPFIPVIEKIKNLGQNYLYIDSLGTPPLGYQNTYYPEYYVYRNLEVIDFLQKKPWVLEDKLVVAGHSEGSFIATKLAFSSNKVTHLIYTSGSPLGRILSTLTKIRKSDTDSTQYSQDFFNSWQRICEDDKKFQNYLEKAEYYFSQPIINDILQLDIPILVNYGTLDEASPFNDYLRIEAIRQKKRNITFKAYVGLDHNFFPVKNGKVNYDIFNWDKVFYHWCNWLQDN